MSEKSTSQRPELILGVCFDNSLGKIQPIISSLILKSGSTFECFCPVSRLEAKCAATWKQFLGAVETGQTCPFSTSVSVAQRIPTVPFGMSAPCRGPWAASVTLQDQTYRGPVGSSSERARGISALFTIVVQTPSTMLFT